MNVKLLPSLLKSIERNLTDWIPMGVKDLEIDSPAYCLFLWYQDFSGDYTPHIGVATQKLLDAVNSTKFEDPNEKFDMIWRPQQAADLQVPGRLVVDECDIVENEVENCYEILAEKSGLFEDDEEDDDDDDEDLDEEDESDEDGDDYDEEDDEEDDDEDDVEDVDEEIEKEFVTLAPFREMMLKVAKNLETVDWSSIMPITDDFTILVSDYVGYWLGEHFEQCVSDEKIAKLTERGLLPKLSDES